MEDQIDQEIIEDVKFALINFSNLKSNSMVFSYNFTHYEKIRPFILSCYKLLSLC